MKTREAANKVGSLAASQKDQIVRRNFILQAGRFVEIAREHLAPKMTPRDLSAEWDGHRERLRRVEWPLQSLLGNADEELWTNIIDASLAGMEKQIRNSQNNAEWRITEYDLAISQNVSRGQQVIELGVRWVDATGNEDQQYRDGKPISVSVKLDSTEITDSVKALAERDTDDPELKELLKSLIAVMAVREGAILPEAPKVKSKKKA
jgi:hypothetical protein